MTPSTLEIGAGSALDFAERYSARTVLGRGGMGEVELVHDHRTGREVALKRLLPDGQRDAALVERFRREIALQAALEHPSVVPVYDVGLDPDGQLYFTMKRVTGLTLRAVLDRLRDGDADALADFPRHRLLGIVLSVAEAIEHAHRHGVTHRDLKPSNVMIGEFGEVYVLDWGIAEDGSASGRRHADASGGSGARAYAAPEQLAGEPSGPPADLWGLGALLFEALTLERPRRPGESVLAAVEDPSQRSPARDVPPELDRLCASALTVDPSARLADAARFADALRASLEEEQEARRRGELTEACLAEAEETLAAERGPEARARALELVGRALGLAVGDRRPIRLLARLLGDPPDPLPAEVAAELERVEREELRDLMVRGARITAAILLAYLISSGWLGVLDPWLHAATVVGGVVVLAASWSGRRPGRSRMPEAYVFVVVSAIVFACSTRILGPLILAPGIFLPLTIVCGAAHRRRDRLLLPGILVTTFLVCTGLEAMGLWAPSYEVIDGQLQVAPRFLALEDGRVTVLVAVATLLGFDAALGTHAFREQLSREERRTELVQWQLRQLVGGERLDGAESSRVVSAQGSAAPRA